MVLSFTPAGHFSRDFPRFLFSPRRSWAEAKSAERRQIDVAVRWGAIPFAIAIGVYAATGSNVLPWGIGLGAMVGFLVWNGLEKRRLAAKYPEAE